MRQSPRYQDSPRLSAESNDGCYRRKHLLPSQTSESRGFFCRAFDQRVLLRLLLKPRIRLRDLRKMRQLPGLHLRRMQQNKFERQPYDWSALSFGGLFPVAARSLTLRLTWTGYPNLTARSYSRRKATFPTLPITDVWAKFQPDSF